MATLYTFYGNQALFCDGNAVNGVWWSGVFVGIYVKVNSILGSAFGAVRNVDSSFWRF